MFVDLDTTFAAFADIARPYLQDTISKTPPTLDDEQRALPRHPARSWSTRRPLRGPPAGRRGAERPPPARSWARCEAGIPALRALAAAQQPAGADGRLRPLALQRRLDVRTGIDRLIDTQQAAEPAARFIAPRSRSATTRRCSSATSASRPARATTRQLGTARSRSTPRPARTTRAARPPRRPTAAAPTHRPTTCTSTRTRTPPRRARPLECEAGNEDYAQGGKQRSATPRQPGDQYRGPDPLPARTTRAPDGRASRDRSPARATSTRASTIARRLGLSFFTTGCWRRSCSSSSPTSPTQGAAVAQPGYTATATFENAATLRQTAPVRIAGVNVGKVTSRSSSTATSRSHVHRRRRGPAAARRREITIRPRLFLDGNYFLDLQPGSPSAPDLPDGGSIPVTHDPDRCPARPGADARCSSRTARTWPAARGLRLGALRHADGGPERRAMDPTWSASQRPQALNESFATAAGRQDELAGQRGFSR